VKHKSAKDMTSQGKEEMKSKRVSVTLNYDLARRFQSVKEFRAKINHITETELVRFLITLGIQEVEQEGKKE
jgi:hypothetical protein